MAENIRKKLKKIAKKCEKYLTNGKPFVIIHVDNF